MVKYRMLNRIQALLDVFPNNLTASQHYRNLAIIGTALLIVMGLIAGWSVVFSILVTLAGAIAALLVHDWLGSQPAGNGAFRQASERIRSGAQLFLINLYKSIIWLSLFLFLLIGVSISWGTAIGFLIGVLASELIGYLGFNISMNSRSMTQQANSRNLLAATQLALSSGVISGLLVLGAALSGLAFYYTILIASQTEQMVAIFTGLATGAASVSLFVSVSGAIFIQSSNAACQNSNALNNPQDTASQPANIIQFIAQHVGDCAGLITDLFATVVTALVASIIINKTYPTHDLLVTFPLVIVAVAILSVIVILQVIQRLNSDIEPTLMLKRLMISSAMLTAIVLMPVSWLMFDDSQLLEQASLSINQIYQSVLIGLFLAVLISLVGSCQSKITQTATNTSILGEYADIVLYLAILTCLLIAYRAAGLIGIELTVISMLSLSAMMVAVANLSLVFDPTQSGSIQPAQRTEQQLGADSKSITRAYDLVASALTALILTFAIATQLLSNPLFSLLSLQLLFGFVSGVVIIACFCGLIIKVISGVILNSQPLSASHYAIAGIERRCKQALLIPALVPVLMTIIFATIFGNKVMTGVIIGVGFGGLLIGLGVMTGGKTWLFIKRCLDYFWTTANMPKDWHTIQNQSWMLDPYRRTIVSTLGPMIKVIAILALLLAV